MQNVKGIDYFNNMVCWFYKIHGPWVLRGCTPPWTHTHTHPAHCMLGYTTPTLVNRITDRFKNITFPQLRLRAVNVEKRIILHY